MMCSLEGLQGADLMLEALRQRHLVAAVAVLGEMPEE